MAIEGFQDGGTAVEPTTGNEVPIGSLPNEVADDIPARLSEGEFVLPADVVRFIGLERLMKLRDEAKEGLRRMAEVGQMGNAEDVGEKAEESFEEEDTGKFESDIDEIMSEVDSVEGQTEQAFAQGGVVGGAPWLTGFDLKRAPKNPVFDVRYYKHPDGRIMYVTFFNGKPMTPIPDGFTPTDKPTEQLVGKEAEEKKEAKEEQRNVGEGGMGEGAPSGAPDVGAIARGDESALATGTTVSPAAVKGVSLAAGLLTGLPFGVATMGKSAQKVADFLTMQSGKMAGQQNIEAVGKAFGIDTSTTEGKAAASSIIDSMSARPGSALDQVSAEQGGRGGTAAAAGASAAAAAAEAGLSAAAQGQASRDAASAVLAGTDAQSAVSNAVSAAIDAAQGGSTVGVDALGPGGTQGGSEGMTGGPDGMDIGPGFSFKKGGLVSKRQKPMKKPKGKGLAAR